MRPEAVKEHLADRKAVIADLREDRDRWRQATALLADQWAASRRDHPPAQRSEGFWKRLSG